MKLHEIKLRADRALNLEWLLSQYGRQGVITAEQFCQACRDIGVDEKVCAEKELVEFLGALAPPEYAPHAGRSAGLGDSMQYTMSAASQSGLQFYRI